MRQTPRPDQLRVIEAIKHEARHGRRRVLVRMPTGAGKTTVAACLIEDAQRLGNSCWVVVHREELAKQAAARISGQGVSVGICMGTAESTVPGATVQVWGIQTLHNRILASIDGGAKVEPPRLAIFDEAHHGVSPTWARVIAYTQAARAVALLLTATPWTEGGKGLGIADALVDGPSPRELVELGVLVEPTIYCGPTPDLSGTPVAGNDFAQAALAQQTNLLVGDVVRTWKSKGEDRSTLAFAVNVAHSQLMTQEFRAAGITAEHVDGTTQEDEREAIFQRLGAGETRVVCNVGIVTEGFDCPTVGTVILARPTQSETLFVQMCGRGARSSPGKKNFIILDHGYNCLRHGHPMTDRPVTLSGRGPRRKVPEKDLVNQSPNFRLCPNVACMMACDVNARQCPTCGADIKPGGLPKEKRSVDLVKFTELPPEQRDKVKIAERRAAFYKMQLGSKNSGTYKGAWDISYAYAKRFGIMPHQDQIFQTLQERQMYWVKRKRAPT